MLKILLLCVSKQTLTYHRDDLRIIMPYFRAGKVDFLVTSIDLA